MFHFKFNIGQIVEHICSEAEDDLSNKTEEEYADVDSTPIPKNGWIGRIIDRRVDKEHCIGGHPITVYKVLFFKTKKSWDCFEFELRRHV